MTVHNIYKDIPEELTDELIEVLLKGRDFRVERIVSRGHRTSSGTWFDQETAEWVMVLRGSAGLKIRGQKTVNVLTPGDYVYLPAHEKHRVEWTDENVETVWLAIHINP
jgi:cupin 2 domain-containing protein